MRRPLALVGFACLFASAVSSFIGVWSGAAALFCAAFGVVLCLFPRFRRVPVAIIALFACAVQFFLGYAALQRLTGWEALADTDAAITAVVLEDATERYGSYTAPVRITSLCTETMDEPAEARVTVRLSFGKRRALAGESLTGRVHFYLPSDAGGFSARSNAHAKNQALYAYLYTHEPYTLAPGKTPLLAAARRELLSALDVLLPEAEAEMAKGVVFGVQDGLDEGITADFRTVGATHLLVVSGAHMSVIANALLRLLQRKEHKLGLPAALFISLCIVGFMGVTGWTPSVVRSGVMCLVGVLAALFHAEYDACSGLGLSVLALCAVYPLAGGGMSLCLSFLSVLGILRLSPLLSRWVRTLARRTGRLAPAAGFLLENAAVSTAAVAFTLPVQALFLGGVSLLSPLISVVMIPLATVMLPFGLLAALLGCVPALLPLARLLALPCGWCARLMTAAASFCSDALGWSYLPARAWVVPAAVGILFLVMLCVLSGAKRKARIACAAMSLVILCISWVGWRFSAGQAVRFAACGEESLVLFAQNKAYILALGEDDAVPVGRALRENGARGVEVLRLANGNEPLRDAATAVLEEFPAKTLLLPADARPDELLLDLTEAPVIPYDNSSALQLRYEHLLLQLENGWAVAFPGGVAAPTAAGVRIETADGALEVAYRETIFNGTPLVLLEEDGIVYIDCRADGQVQVRRADGWPR